MATIGNVMITYDVNKLHSDVKNSMESIGYYSYFTLNGSSKIYYMPNTSLWHKAKSSEQALNDLKSICSNLGVNLEKAVAVKASEFTGI